jgi:hypothetical protein
VSAPIPARAFEEMRPMIFLRRLWKTPRLIISLWKLDLRVNIFLDKGLNAGATQRRGRNNCCCLEEIQQHHLLKAF